MGKIVLVAVIMLSLMGLAPASLAATAPDSARGNVTLDNGGGILLNARSGPTGEDPQGRFVRALAGGGGGVRAKVTCLRVAGTVAYVGLEITQASDPSAVGGKTVWVFEDEPDSVSETDAPDDNCTATTITLTDTFVVDKGDLRVVDN